MQSLFSHTKRKGILLLALGLLLSCALYAQGTVGGVVMDSLTRKPIGGATVEIRVAKGTANKRFTVSGSDGRFIIDEIPLGDTVLLHLSHTGYEGLSIKRVARINTGLRINTVPDSFFLLPRPALMEAVTIRLKVPPIAYRRDTVEFVADSFLTDRNAALEDLLKVLPGMQVDAQGNISYNNRPVGRILVDGQDFFSGDGTKATRFIPAEMISRLQFSDLKSRPEDEGSTQLSLNIKLKAGFKSFGTVWVSGNAKNRAGANGLASSLQDKDRITVLGAFNKLGAPAKSGKPALRSGSSTAGINYSGKRGRWTIAASYAFSGAESSTASSTSRTLFTDSDSIFQVRNSGQFSYDKSQHRFNLSAEYALDARTTLGIRLNAEARTAGRSEQSDYTIFSDSLLRTRIAHIYDREEGARSGSATFLFNHKFKSSGGQLALNLHTSLSSANGRSHNISTSNLATASFNRALRDSSSGTHHYIDLSFNQPVGQRLQVQWQGSFDISGNRLGQRTLNLDPSGTGTIDSTLTAGQSISSRTASQSLTLGYRQRALSLDLGLGASSGRLANSGSALKSPIIQQQTYYRPQFGALYAFSDKQRLRFRFSSTVAPPTADQLFPVADNSNTILVKTGNPNLRPAFRQSFQLFYNSYSKSRRFTAEAEGLPVRNNVVARIFFDTGGLQHIGYENVNGTYIVRGNAALSQLLGRNGTDQLMASVNGQYLRDAAFVLGQLQYAARSAWRGSLSYYKRQKIGRRTRTYTAGLDAGYGTSHVPQPDLLLTNSSLFWQPRFELGYFAEGRYELKFSGSFAHTGVRNNGHAHTQISYDNISLLTNATVHFGSRLSGRTNISFRNNGDAALGKASILLCDVSATILLFRNKKGLLEFSCFDLFNQNRDYTRTVADGSVYESSSVVPRLRYGLRFSYRFSIFDKKASATAPRPDEQ